jgi:hypothetical protein
MQEYVLVKKQSGKLTNLDQGQDGQLKFEYARICAAIPYLFHAFDVGENIFYMLSYVKTSKWVERKNNCFSQAYMGTYMSTEAIFFLFVIVTLFFYYITKLIKILPGYEISFTFL